MRQGNLVLSTDFENITDFDSDTVKILSWITRKKVIQSKMN